MSQTSEIVNVAKINTTDFVQSRKGEYRAIIKVQAGFMTVVDDLGIQQAMERLYNIDASNKKLMKEKMLQLSNKWSPYRTYACLHLWSWKDNTPKP